MIERPILFKPEMVRAILDGKKTQTRRMTGFDQVNLRPVSWEHHGVSLQQIGDNPWTSAVQFLGKSRGGKYGHSGRSHTVSCSYGQPGDKLWIRETWAKCYFSVIYRADEDRKDVTWRPSIHMPRIHCRLSLSIAEIGVERLQDISEEDALAEGIESTEFYQKDHPPSICFSILWDSINGKTNPWKSNPWVWVIRFIPIKPWMQINGQKK